MKKIISRIMLFVMLVSCIGGAAFTVSAEEYTITDQQFNLLREVGVVYGDSIEAAMDPSKVITRAEAAVYFSRMMRISHMVKEPAGYEALFYDTTTETKNYKYIKACVEAGLLNGYTDGNFGPEDTINSKDAAKVLLYTIGYKNYIAVTNIDFIINKTGIMSGVAVTDNTTYAQFMTMVCNALHAPACVQTGFKGDEVIYNLSDSVLAMEDRFNLYYGRGTVDGAVGTSLIMPNPNMLSNMIAIDGLTYEYNGNSSDLLGYDVEFYYRKNLENKMGGRKIVYAGISKRNNVLTVKADDIASYSNRVFKYYQGNNTKSVTFTPYTNVIYNGIAYPMYSNGDLIPDSGSVTFIDNNDDNVYDVVSIEKFDYILVGNIDVVNEVVYDQNDVDKINLGETERYSIKWTGEEYTFDRLLRGHLLKIKATKKDSGYYVADIELSRDERTNALVESVTKEKIYAGGSEYDRWSKLDEKSVKALTTGSYVTLYLDGNMVVRVIGGGDGSNYGYLVAFDSEGTFQTDVKALIVDAATAKSQVYDLGKKIQIDGTSVLSTAAESTLLTIANNQPLFMQKGTVAQPIKYKVNDKGNITHIDTYVMDAKEDSDTALRLNTYENAKFSSAHTGFNDGTTHFGSYAANSPRLRVPENPADLEKYCVLAPASVDGFDGYDIALCNRDEIYISEAVYFYLTDEEYDMTKPKYQTPMVIVTDKITEIDENGDVIETVTCRATGVDNVYALEPAEWSKYPAFDIGDLVRIEKDATDRISKVEVVYDVSQGMPEYDGTASKRIVKNETSTLGHIPLNYGYRAYWVTPLIIKNNVMRVCMSSKDDAEGFKTDFYADNLTYADAEVYKYRMKNGIAELESATINDVVTNAMNSENPSELLVNVISSKIRHILIFE